MAFASPVQLQTPFRDFFTDHLLTNPCSPFDRSRLLGYSRLTTAKSTSTASLVSAISLPSPNVARHLDPLHQRVISRSFIDLRQELRGQEAKGLGSRSTSGQSSVQTVLYRPHEPPVPQCTSTTPFEDIQPVPVPRQTTQDWIEDSAEPYIGHRLRPERVTRYTFNTTGDHVPEEYEDAAEYFARASDELYTPFDVYAPVNYSTTLTEAPRPGEPPLRRWLSNLKKRHRQQTSALKAFGRDLPKHSGSPQSGRLTQGDTDDARPSLSFESSLDLVGDTKTASITLASLSVAPLSQFGDARSMLRRRGRYSGFSDLRTSIDSTARSTRRQADEKVRERFHKRQQILEELLASEESYVSDLKTLSTTYFTILAGAAHLSGRTRVHRAIVQIHQLHRELLLELRKVIAEDNRQSSGLAAIAKSKLRRRRRWQSTDSAPVSTGPVHADVLLALRSSVDTDRLTKHGKDDDFAVAHDVVQVARIFDSFMARFFAYEAFLANIETMQGDADMTARVMPTWNYQERGVEALAKTLSPEACQDYDYRKGLTFDDLLIKPVQRICKYALFFTDLCRHTPSCDDPVAHEWLERIHSRLDETAAELDQATDNPKTRHCIEVTWRLEDRLMFPSNLGMTKIGICRLLGHVLLCGALYAASISAEDKAKGCFSVAILYRSRLVLASPSKEYGRYHVDAIIPLLFASLDEVNNGKGLQCHTAPFSWKLAFEHKNNRYEILLCACSEEEEHVWREEMRLAIMAETSLGMDGHQDDREISTLIPLGCRPVGQVWRHQASKRLRRDCVQRAATVNPKPFVQQVIIKNTTALKNGNVARDDLSPTITRSQSYLSPHNVPVLAPRRAERIRLEASLHDVWTKSMLPYPGMPIRRLDNPLRASAQSVIRKFSMTSLASNFSRRSTDLRHNSATSSRRGDDSCTASTRSIASTAATSISGLVTPALQGMHQVILPDDFDQPRKPDAKGDQYAAIASIVGTARGTDGPSTLGRGEQGTMHNRLVKRSHAENPQGAMTAFARASTAAERPSMQAVAKDAPPPIPAQRFASASDPKDTRGHHSTHKAKSADGAAYQKKRRIRGRLASLAKLLT